MIPSASLPANTRAAAVSAVPAGSVDSDESAGWREFLVDTQAALSLPLDRQFEDALPVPGGAASGSTSATVKGSATVSVPMPPTAWAALDRLTSAQTFAPAEVLAAALFALLHVATGQEDLVLALLADNASPLDDALPLRVRVTGDRAFSAVLTEVRAQFLKHADWQRLPSGQRRALWAGLAGAPADGTGSEAPGPEAKTAADGAAGVPPLVALAWSARGADTATATTTVTVPAAALRFALGPDGLTVGYDAHRYQAAAAMWLGRHLVQVLGPLAEAPAATVTELDFTNEEERAQLIAWSRGGPATEEPKRFPERFAQEVAARPDAPAVIAPEGTVSFAALDTLSNRLANHLRADGVAANQVVALCLARSVELVVAVLAIFKAGGAVFMLDPAAPPERQSALLALTRPRLILTDGPSVSSLPPDAGAAGAAVVRLDEPAAAWRTEPTAPLPCTIEPGHRAILFQTSGSTGLPKIVVESFGFWRGPAAWGAGDRTLLKSNAGTSFSLVEAMAVITGATVYVVPAGLEQDFTGLGAFIALQGITHAVFSASALRVFLDCAPPSVAGALKTVICIGERIPPELKTRFAAQLPGTALTVGYGCTEARGATSRRCGADDDVGLVDVGRPVRGMEVLVLDARGRLSPVGVPGEIYIGGQLADGYLDDPVATAAAFVAHPWDPSPGARLFRTRDRGRILPDGTLEVRGRLDQQVKIRGYRVETGEVEAALARIPEVGIAAVIRREDRPGDARLVAYLTPQVAGGDVPAVAELRQLLQRVLPSYAVPTAYVVQASLPLTSSGKIDRRALAALPGPGPGAGSGSAAAPSMAEGANTRAPTRLPRTELENLLAGVWREALGLETLGCDDNFFELGGHSLVATRIVATVERKTGRRVPIAVLFRAPTVAALARWMEGEVGSGCLVPLRREGERAPLFCIHGMTGDAFTFVYLARALVQGRPVCALQARDLDGRTSPHGSVVEMAADYVREIRAAYPHGPYHLVGYSLGGWIAYAIAQEFTRQGARVGLVAVLDTTTLARLPFGLGIVERCLRRYDLMCFHLRYTRIYIRRYSQRIFRIGDAGDAKVTGEASSSAAPGGQGPASAAVDPYAALVSRYRAERYAGDLTVFRAERTPASKLRFWAGLVKGRLTRRTINGNHGTFLREDNAGAVANAIDARLAELETDTTAMS